MALQKLTSRLRNGPDFICIGMMKAATGWLYDQLQFHPDFWMPPFKEFHFFDKPFPSPGMRELARAANEDLEGLNDRRRAKTLRVLDDRDLAFLQRVSACEGEPIEVDRYAALFAPKGRLLSGDITPAFSSLAAEVVAPLAQRLPEARIVLMVRDPVERMWSQITVTALAKTGSVEALSDVDSVRRLMLLKQVQTRSRPTEILGRWRDLFGEEQVGAFFFEDVVARPDRVLAQVLDFLGADSAKPSAIAPDFNRKSVHPRVPMTPDVRALLVKNLRDELDACAYQLGEQGREWAQRYAA